MLDIGDVYWCDGCNKLVPKNDTWEVNIYPWEKTIKAMRCPWCKYVLTWSQPIKENK